MGHDVSSFLTSWGRYLFLKLFCRFYAKQACYSAFRAQNYIHFSIYATIFYKISPFYKKKIHKLNATDKLKNLFTSI